MCRAIRKNLVNHHVKEHPDHEVFISRITEEMRRRIEAGTIHAVAHSNGKIDYVCPFCESCESKTPMNWLSHLTVHTGEYIYQCGTCDVRLAHKSHPKAGCSRDAIVEKIKIPIEMNGIYGFICDLCNYVQLQEGQLKSHLRLEHQVHSTREKYSRILLLKTVHPPAPAAARNANSPECPFCGVSHDLDEKGWLYHLARHTEEYHYKCSGCNQKVDIKDEHLLDAECKSGTSKDPFHIDATIADEGIFGYVCKYCRVVKLARGVVIKHISKEHGIKNVLDGDIELKLLIALPRETSEEESD